MLKGMLGAGDKLSSTSCQPTPSLTVVPPRSSVKYTVDRSLSSTRTVAERDDDNS